MFSWYIQILIIKLKHSHCWKLDDARIFSVLSDDDSQWTLQRLSIQTKHCTVHFWQSNGICINMLYCILSISQSVRLKEWELFVFLFFSEIGSSHKPIVPPKHTSSSLFWMAHILQISHYTLPHGLIFVSIAWHNLNFKKTVISCLIYTCCN